MTKTKRRVAAVMISTKLLDKMIITHLITIMKKKKTKTSPRGKASLP